MFTQANNLRSHLPLLSMQTDIQHFEVNRVQVCLPNKQLTDWDPAAQWGSG